MDVAEITAKARVLLEALPYIQDFRGSTFVVKYGGSFMDDPSPEVRNRVAYDIAFLAAVGIHVVVVHGGGKAITKAMAESGLKANFVNGMRVTDDATIKIVKRTLDEVVNKDVCHAITLARGKPSGLPGDSVLLCEKLTVDDDGNTVDLGYVGDVTEVRVKVIKKELSEGLIPVISPVAEDQDGHPYNINADVAAGKIAGVLQAEKVIFMTNTPGVLDKAGELLTGLTPRQVDELIADGTISGGMIPKVGYAVDAVNSGVKTAHIIDGRVEHALLLEVLTPEGVGTLIKRA